MKNFKCSMCSYTTNYKHHLKRHSKTNHLDKNKALSMGSENYNTPITHYQQGQTGQNEQAMKNIESYYKDQIAKLNESLKYQQNKHHQQLKDQQCALQQQYNIEITNIQKQNNIEKENLCKEYQHCINQNGVQFHRALENEIGRMCKEYQHCIDQNGMQWQHALNCKQNQYNKMKDIAEDLQECIDEYLQAGNMTKGEYCCQVCGKKMKHHIDLLIHMKNHI